jgi:hypothetical protein
MASISFRLKRIHSSLLNSGTFLPLALLGTLMLAAPGRTTANITYTYGGNGFTQFNQSYACPPVCRITGSFTVAQPLAANLVYRTQIFPVSFSFTDGLNLFTDSSPTTHPVFLIGTDASGSITSWFIEFDIYPNVSQPKITHLSYTCNAPDCPPAVPTDWTTDVAPDGVTVTNWAEGLNSPGTWTQGPGGCPGFS